MEPLVSVFNQLSTKVSEYKKICPEVSKADVGWHIAHSTIVVKQIIEQLEKSTPENYKWTFNKARFFVFAMNKIPRGKAKAPNSVQVDGEITTEILQKFIEKANEKLNLLASMHPKQNFVHPFFGMLDLKGTKKVLLMHTAHHIQIINDIIKKAQ